MMVNEMFFTADKIAHVCTGRNTISRSIHFLLQKDKSLYLVVLALLLREALVMYVYS